MFLLVFALSEGATYGWFRPVKDFSVGGVRLWPNTLPVSLIPLIFGVAAVILFGFYRLERRKEREDRGPLFAFGQLRILTFRYGLLTTMMLAMGQLGLLFVLPVFLQEGRHLSAETNGFWVLPTGLFIVVGAQLGGRLTRRVGTTAVARGGLVLETIGLVVVALVVSPHLSFLTLLPGFALYGFGIGFASSQLTNVVLSAIEPEEAGAASGANTTVRQIGSALGVAVIGSIVTSETIRRAVTAVHATAELPRAVQEQAAARLRALGPNFAPPHLATTHQAAILERIVADAVASATRPSLLFAAAVVGTGAVLSLLIPRIGPPVELEDVEALELANA
jgi:MFS family permease